MSDRRESKKRHAPQRLRASGGRRSFGCAALLGAMGWAAPAAAQDRAIFDFDAPGQPVDISGSGVQAIVFGATHTNAGFEGGAYEFDGVNDWIRVGLDANPSTDAFPQFSMGAFVRLDSNASAVQTVLSTDNANFDRSLVVDSRFGPASWSAYSGKCSGSYPGPAAVPSSDWHLVAVVYDRFAVHDLDAGLWGTVRLYVDGVESQAWACPGESFDFIGIGKNPGFGEFFDGAIDNAFFFSGILSKAQLDQIRLGGKAALLSVEPENSERERFLHEGFDPEPRSEDVILAAGNMSGTPPLWAYRTSNPGRGWANPRFDDSSWPRGAGGFGVLGVDTWEQDRNRTEWLTPDLFARTTFQLDAEDLASRDGAPIALWGRWHDRIEVFINGVPAMLLDPALTDGDPRTPDGPRGHDGRSIDGDMFLGDPPYAEGLVVPVLYRYVALTAQATESLVVGENTIAIHAKRISGGYFDMGVVKNPFDGMPSRGYSTLPGTDRFLAAAQRFAATHLVPTLSYAVMVDGHIVANHTLGYLDKHQERPAPRDTFFRIASLNKAVTAACVRRLIAQGFVDPVSGEEVRLEAPFWPFLLSRGLVPPTGASIDPRMASMTIEHLLNHASGVGYTPLLERLYEQFGPSARAMEMAGALYAAPLLFTPGTSTQYSNEGYFLLNFLVRELTGDTEAFIESELLQAAEAGIDPMVLSTEQLATRPAQETWYRTRFLWPFDYWLVLDDSGNLSVTAQAYLRFVSRFALWSGDPIPTFGHWFWGSGGESSGATSNVYQELHEGRATSFILLTNQHDYLLQPLWEEFHAILDDLPASRNIRRR